jgi:hydrogenase maturation factor
MRLYGKRFFRRTMDQEAQYRRESRDGIVWEHLPDQRLVRVKIQGSDELVVAWYPENWQKTPVFLKAGNAVRIAHVGGNRKRIEVVGHGLTIPTPVGGGMFPAIPAGADYWVSGGGLLSTETPSLRVQVLPGTVRIDGVHYDLSFDPVMGDPMEMGDGVVIGSGIGIEEIDPPPDFSYPYYGETAQYRYDAFVVGTDGVVDYLKGTATIGTTGPPYYNPVVPEKPAIPDDHVLIGDYILVYSGMTAIQQSDIGRIFAAAQPSRLIIVTEAIMAWHDPDLGPPPDYVEIPHPTDQAVELRMIDQYGNPARYGGNYLFNLEFPAWIDGNGGIGQRSIAGSTIDPDNQPITGYASYNYFFSYQRANADANDGYADDVTPGLHGWVDFQGIRYDASASIKLLDENGLVMIYGARVPLNPGGGS